MSCRCLAGRVSVVAHALGLSRPASTCYELVERVRWMVFPAVLGGGRQFQVLFFHRLMPQNATRRRPYELRKTACRAAPFSALVSHCVVPIIVSGPHVASPEQPGKPPAVHLALRDTNVAVGVDSHQLQIDSRRTKEHAPDSSQATRQRSSEPGSSSAANATDARPP